MCGARKCRDDEISSSTAGCGRELLVHQARHRTGGNIRDCPNPSLRNLDVERPGGFHVDDHLELAGCLSANLRDHYECSSATVVRPRPIPKRTFGIPAVKDRAEWQAEIERPAERVLAVYSRCWRW